MPPPSAVHSSSCNPASSSSPNHPPSILPSPSFSIAHVQYIPLIFIASRDDYKRIRFAKEVLFVQLISGDFQRDYLLQ
jgi:hypothetical protein